MPTKIIADEHHVLRHCKAREVERDDKAGIRELFPQALQLKDNERYLSASYYEYYAGTHDQRLRSALNCLRNRRKVKDGDALAMMNAGAIRDCGKGKDLKLRVLHEGSVGKEDYAALRGIPADHDAELSELLSQLAVRDITFVTEIP